MTNDAKTGPSVCWAAGVALVLAASCRKPAPPPPDPHVEKAPEKLILAQTPEEEGAAAELAESVRNAMVEAIRSAAFDATKREWSATLLLKNPSLRYSFRLPKLEENRHHPGEASISPEDAAEKLPAFGPFPDGFAFSFSMRKINTLSYLLGTEKPDRSGTYTIEDLDPLTKVYEVRTSMFRLPADAAPESTDPPVVAARIEKRMLAVLVTRFALK